MHLTVPVYSRGIFRAVLAVVFELEPLTAKCAGSADREHAKWRNVASLPYPLGDAFSFSSALASLDQGAMHLEHLVTGIGNPVKN